MTWFYNFTFLRPKTKTFRNVNTNYMVNYCTFIKVVIKLLFSLNKTLAITNTSIKMYLKVALNVCIL